MGISSNQSTSQRWAKWASADLTGGTAHLGAQHVIAPLAGLGACLEPAGLRWGSPV